MKLTAFARNLGSVNPSVHSIAAILLATSILAGCAAPGKRTGIGAGAGAAGGAGIGAIAGGGKGALIGAGIGAALGGMVGNRLDKQANELAEVAETKRTQDGILVKLKNDLLFETGKAVLTPAAVTQIEQLSAVLVKYPTNAITITGHTDNVGGATFNDGLSLQRARSVHEVFLKNGVSGNHLKIDGAGSSRPIASNKTKEGRAQNRRVELSIVDTEAKK